MSKGVSYYRRLLSTICLALGFTLLIEHLYVWGGFDISDFPLGHEWLGLILVIAGFILGLRS